MLAELPHVGAVIAADEGDRVRRLMRMLLAMADDRARRYAAVRAGTITEYRSGGGAPDEQRIIILLDGFAAFRQQYESADGGRWFDALANLAADGRPLGIHLILTADRPASLPSRFSSRVQRRLVLRLADDNDYFAAGAEAGALTLDSPPGRGLLGRAEFQVALFGGATGTTAQSRAISQLAAAMRRQQVPDAPRVEQLPEIVRLSELPAMAEGRPAIGVADDSLGPAGFRPDGVFLISGPPASGRTTAVATAIIALDRAAPGVVPVLFGGKRSPLASLGIWQQIATDPAEVAEAAAKIDQAAAGSGEGVQRYAVVIEAVSEFLSTVADAPLAAMIKTLTRLGHVVIAEAETSALGGGWPLLNAVKSGRTGLALQPEQGDGTIVYKTDFPRGRRADYPPGRGLLVEGGRVRLLQVAIPE
jgi:S-DNA-T family DNA segregation ATPase FtsK/SpoIIIE